MRRLWTSPFPFLITLVLCLGLLGKALPAHAQVELSPANRSKLQLAALRFSDNVEQGDWNGAAQQLRLICETAKPVIVRFDAASEPCTRAVIRLGRAVQQHDRSGALHGDNKLLEWLAITFRRPNVPVEAARLGYLARELRLLATEDKPKKWADRVAEVRPCWNQLVLALGADGDPSLKEDGDAIIRRLELAATPADLLQVQAPFAKLVERINQAFDRVKE